MNGGERPPFPRFEKMHETIRWDADTGACCAGASLPARFFIMQNGPFLLDIPDMLSPAALRTLAIYFVGVARHDSHTLNTEVYVAAANFAHLHPWR